MDRDLEVALARLATKEDIERFREDMTASFERIRRDIRALIDWYVANQLPPDDSSLVTEKRLLPH